MNFQDQALNQANPINKQNGDAQIAEKASQFLKLIQSKIALKSFEGARAILLTVYATTLLSEDVITYLNKQIEKAEQNYKKDGNRFYWQWYVIFIVSTLSAGYMIWKYGIYQRILKTIKSTCQVAKSIIGTVVYTCVAVIGTSFVFLCKTVNKLINKIFS